MNEIQVRESPPAIIVRLDEARRALTVASNDFERFRIRDQARTVEAAAKIWNRRDIQVQASVLVQEVEREIAKANPPMSYSEAGARKGKKPVTPEEPLIKPSTLRSIRQAHDKISDSEFDSIVGEFVFRQEVLTRKQLLLRVQGRKNVGRLTLYFIQAERLGLIKIGKTGNPVGNRLSSMQAESPDKLKLLFSVDYSADVDLEAELHNRFKELREHGEWFRPTADLMDYIACLSGEA